MVWEQRTATIVMMTKLEERTRVSVEFVKGIGNQVEVISNNEGRAALGP